MSTKITTPELVEQIKEDFDAVYNAAYEKGKDEGGVIDYDTFWDSFQNHGEPTDYEYAFSYGRMPNEIYNPKYPIVCSNGNAYARFIFFNNTSITDTKVPIDVTAITTGTVLQQTFVCYKVVSALERIAELRVAEHTDYPYTFMGCNKLKSLTIVGTIGKSINLGECPLDDKSIESVYEALSTNATGQTCTLKKSAVNAIYTTEEWQALTDAKSNWTFTLA